MTYNVCIVDDHFVVREGIKLIIETNPTFKVVGEASNGKEALKRVKDTQPDVVLMDLMMPVMSGLEAIEQLNKSEQMIPIIILTTYNEEDLILKGIELGAKGFLFKDMQRHDLFRALEAAVNNEVLLPPEVVNTVMEAKLKKEKEQPKVTLTVREVEIMKAVARGYRSKEIASDLEISERTVKAHLTNIYQKLNVDSRSEAVARSIESGIIDFKKR